MNIFKKKVKYFKFFEDSKLVEIDQDNKRLAIIFFGKENIIHIFDASPYINYMPIEEIQVKSEEEEEKVPESEPEYENIKEIFDQLKIKKNSSKEDLCKTIFTDNQEYIKFRSTNITLENPSNQNSNNFNIPLSDHSKIHENQDKINLNLDSKYKNKKINFSIHKPKIKTKILSVISCPSNIIIGIKWINITQLQSINGQENSQNNKLLLAIFEDGNLNAYCLKSANYEIQTKVHLTKLQYMPFESYPEQWKIAGQVYTGKPIRDYYISVKSNRLYTLHSDNYIIMWMIAYIGVKFSFLASYAINITPDLSVNKILVDKNEQFIFSFHNQSFKIFIIQDKPPFHLVYTKNYDDIEIMHNGDGSSKSVDNSKLKLQGNSKKYNGKNEDDITPIKKVADNFIDSNESYQIFYKDLFDLSEGMKIYDINFFFNVQKPEFSLLEEYLIIPVYQVKTKQYVLLKFLLREFVEKLQDISYLKKSRVGENNDILKVLMISYSPIVFANSPFFYFINEHTCDEGILDKKMNCSDIMKSIYQPIVVINEEKIHFMNITTDSILFKSDLPNDKIINPEYLIITWTLNNTILLSSTKILMSVLKFCNENKILGIPINPKKIADLRSSES